MSSQLMLVLVPLVVLLLVCVATARKQPPYLKEDHSAKTPRAAECQFGKQLHEIGAVWFADLGPPFGVMYCIRCECIRVQKKRRSIAKVQCRNIKNECPKPTCDEPVLYPGRCCKVCARDLDSPDQLRDVAPVVGLEEEEKNMRHFASLLTLRTSLVLRRDDAGLSATAPQQHAYVATGRFTFHRKNLYYSFYTSEGSGRPRALQFVDYDGNILEEQAMLSSVYQNATGKVCGVWRRVPREYRRLLREEKMYVWLIWSNGEKLDHTLSGQVARYRSLGTELFSALLEPSPDSNLVAMKGSGGTAIVSASSSAPSVHISLVFNGVFSPEETSDIPLVVRLELVDKQLVVLEEVVRVTKPSHELNVVEVQSTVSSANLRQLAKGRLVLSVTSRKKPGELRLEGRVVTRASCEIFQAPLSSADADRNEDETSLMIPAIQTPVSGLSWLYLDRDGGLVYNIRLAELPATAVPILTLVSGRGRRRIELEDLTPSLRSGWANGTLDSLSPKELEQLYAGELALNVATEEDASLVRGKLQERPVADARDSYGPILLERPDLDTPASLVAMAWVAIDTECTLHYEVVLSGLTPEDRSLQLHLKSLPMLAPGAPVSRRLLEVFQGSQLEGFVMGLDQYELSRIDSGVNYLEVQDTQSGDVLLRAHADRVGVPGNCLPHFTDNDVPAISAHVEGVPESPTKCYHEGRFHEDGAQWKSPVDPCAICNCHHGRLKCEAVMCPPLGCANQTRPEPSECCPTCQNVTAVALEVNASATRGCHMAGQFHIVGSSWYPYLPPNGFDTCTVCSCNVSTLEVQCPRTHCPLLDCEDHEAARPDHKSCCKVCPNPVLPAGNDTAVQQDQQSRAQGGPRTNEDVLAEGGCRYPMGGPFENGKEWHPRVYSHGEVKCVKCRCKDGKVKCERKRCLRSTCTQPTPTAGSTSGLRRRPQADDECCSQCKRSRRHHKTPANS